MNVANGFTYLSQDFKLQGGKVGYGCPYLAGQVFVWCAVLIEGAGDLIEVAADFPVLGGQLPNGGKQFIIDRGNGANGANGRPCDSLPDKLGLADVVMLQPPGEVGVFFLGHAGLDYMAAVGRVVSLGYGYQLLSVGVVVLSLIGEKQGVKRNCF